MGNLFPNPSERYAMTNVNCTGLESSLLSCNHAGFGVHQCNGKLPAFLSCTKSRDEFGNIFGDLNHRVQLLKCFLIFVYNYTLVSGNSWIPATDFTKITTLFYKRMAKKLIFGRMRKHRCIFQLSIGSLDPTRGMPLP